MFFNGNHPLPRMSDVVYGFTYRQVNAFSNWKPLSVHLPRQTFPSPFYDGPYMTPFTHTLPCEIYSLKHVHLWRNQHGLLWTVFHGRACVWRIKGYYVLFFMGERVCEELRVIVDCFSQGSVCKGRHVWSIIPFAPKFVMWRHMTSCHHILKSHVVTS